MFNFAPKSEDENNSTVTLPGIVKSVDYANARAIVTIADIDTPPIPWAERTGHLKTWFPPEPGEQVEVVAQGGDFAEGVIIAGTYFDGNPAIGNDENPVIKCAGVTIKINKVSGLVEIVAPSIEITGDLKVNGTIASTGHIHSAADVLAQNVSLKSHKHNLVKAGTDKSGVPE